MAAAALNLSDDLLTYREAAAALGITVEGVKRAVRVGRITPIKIPGRVNVYFRRQDVENYRRPGREIVASMSDARRGSVTDLMPVGATTADEVRLHELRLKGEMFAGIAQNVATQARLAVQPVANPEQITAQFTIMLQQAMAAFVAHFGSERLARILERKSFTADDLAAMFAAFQATAAQLINEPLTPADTNAMREMEALMERYVHAAGALGIDAAPAPHDTGE